MKHPALLLSTLALSAALLVSCGHREPPVPSASVPTPAPAPAETRTPEPVPAPPETPAPTPEPTLAPEPEPVSPALLPAVAEHTAVPDFLDPDQQALYLQAVSLFQVLNLNSDLIQYLSLPDGSQPEPAGEPEQITPEGAEFPYTVAQGRCALWDDFTALLTDTFTEDLLLSLRIGSQFTPLPDGRTAYLSGARGSNIFYLSADLPDEFVLVDQTEDAILFEVVGHYTEDVDLEEGHTPDPAGIYTEQFPIRMERTPQGWRFAEFALPY